MSLDAELFRKLVAPKSIAVVGASGNPNGYGARALMNTVRLGFPGNVAAINPRGEPCGEVPGYRELAQLPWVPEHVAVAVPRSGVETTIRECGELGVSAATIFSNGYGETGSGEGRESQERLSRVAAEVGIRFLGPNCNGVLNIRDRVALTSTRALDDLSLYNKPIGERGYAVVSQSGGLAVVNVMWRALRAGVPIQWVASTGNQASIGAFELTEAALEEDDVRGVLIVLEGMPEAAEVMDVGAKAARAGKFVSCLKLGRSAAGVGAAASHTGSVAGEYAAFEALCAQAGIACVEDASELYEVAMVLSATGGQGPSGGIAMVSISGGNLALMSDALDSRGLPIASFGSETEARLRAVLPTMCSPTNPLDLMTAVQDPKVFEEVLDALTDDPGVGLCVVVLTLNPPGFLDVVVEAARSAKKPVILAWLGGPLTGESSPDHLRRLGMAVYETASACGSALESAYHIRGASGLRGGASDDLAGEYRLASPSSKHELMRRGAPSTAPSRSGGLKPGEVVGGSEALDRLQGWGLDVVEGIVCTTTAEAEQAAAQLGYPVVIKIDDPTIVHKTERKAVHVGIGSVDECRVAAEDLFLNAGTDASKILVQRQVCDVVELFVAARGGAPPGVTIVLGIGGVLVEILRDVTFLFPPFSAAEARAALERLKGLPLLGAFRGQDAVDIDHLGNWLVDFSSVAAPQITEGGTVEVNPVMVPRGGGRPLIVDAALFGSGSREPR